MATLVWCFYVHTLTFIVVVVSERVGPQFVAMTVFSRGAAALPALSLVLLAISALSPSANAQRFDLSQLSLRAAAEAQAGTSGYFNCPEQVRLKNNVNACGIPLPLSVAELGVGGNFSFECIPGRARMGDGGKSIPLHAACAE